MFQLTMRIWHLAWRAAQPIAIWQNKAARDDFSPRALKRRCREGTGSGLSFGLRFSEARFVPVYMGRCSAAATPPMSPMCDFSPQNQEIWTDRSCLTLWKQGGDPALNVSRRGDR
jgi:hypothetical protein